MISLILSVLVLFLSSCSSIENPQQPLTAPQDLTVQQVGLTSVRLTWTVSTSVYDGAYVERKISGRDKEYSRIADIQKDVLLYQDRGLSSDGEYCYRVAIYCGSEVSDYAEAVYAYHKLPVPTDLTAELTDAGLVLSWTDNCIGEDGYIVRKKTGSGAFADWRVLGANVSSVTDEEVVYGTYDYEVIAFASDERSSSATVHFENYGAATLSIGTVQSSCHMVHLPMTMKDDGGKTWEGGICWREDGAAGATLDDNVYTFPDDLNTGDLFFGKATDLEYGKTYSFRPWVRSGEDVMYFSEVSTGLVDEPKALYPDWTDISEDYSMPSSIRLYATSTDVTGRSVNAWYAIADMSAGDLELRTFKTDALTQPSVAAASLENVLVIVNGGYFGSSQSYSYVMDRGKEVAAGVRTLTRSYYDENRNDVSKSYNVTRGAFGVNADQRPSVKWLYGSYQWAYDAPLPMYNSGPQMTPSATVPSPRQSWDVYSAIGGGPVILREGRLCFDYLVTRDPGNGGRYVANYELLGDDIFGPSIRPPRTAIGHTDDGKVVIMVVDGRNSGGSQGVTLDELACLMKGVGCTDVLNLDGGGSSVMCVTPAARILNVPSDGSERKVLSFVALVQK